MEKKNLTESQWKEKLTPEQYHVLREKGTEPPFRNAYYDFKGEGLYLCAACEAKLFDSETKYDSGTGWPSFYQPLSKESVDYKKDTKLGYERTEVVCKACGSHLGHVFEDGPEPTGKRFCMNSTSLKFKEK